MGDFVAWRTLQGDITWTALAGGSNSSDIGTF